MTGMGNGELDGVHLQGGLHLGKIYGYPICLGFCFLAAEGFLMLNF
jgi:hypothetical protein